MQTPSDGAGIYTLGLQPGTVIEGNYIHSIPENKGRAQSNGIYCDQGSTGILVVGNIVHDTRRSPIRLHKAGVNEFRGNILAIDEGEPAFVYGATEMKDIKLFNNTIIEQGRFRRTTYIDQINQAGIRKQ